MTIALDTLLLLRPTQSATVFLQQLGRGLRRTADKPVLTVLDLIGQQRREFRFDRKLAALTGVGGKRLERQLESGFAFLPSGCEIVLDRVTQATILDSVRRHLGARQSELVAELRAAPSDHLASWLLESGRELTDVLRRGSWTGLRRAAGLATASAGPLEDGLLKRVGAVAHVDDQERARSYTELLQASAALPVDYAGLDERGKRLARMLFFSRWPNGGGFASYQEGYDALAAHPAVRDELQQVIALGLEAAGHVPRPLEPGMDGVPMVAHALYSREEVLAALDYASLARRPSSFVAGVVWSETVRTDAFFVTVRKTERDYSPTTMYRDHALTPQLFRWESQNATAADSPTGRRYANHVAAGSHVLLLVRPTKTNDWGGAAPYLCLGPATYVSHQGSRPMAVTWRLRHPLPVDVYREASMTA